MHVLVEKGMWRHVALSGVGSLQDSGEIYRSLIQEGLGWGQGTTGKPFHIIAKSQGSSVCLAMMTLSARDPSPEAQAFHGNIRTAVLMHPLNAETSFIPDALHDVLTAADKSLECILVYWYIIIMCLTGILYLLHVRCN